MFLFIDVYILFEKFIRLMKKLFDKIFVAPEPSKPSRT